MAMAESRRNFFTAGIVALWGGITAALGGTALTYLFAPARSKKSGGWVEAGDIANLKPREPEELLFRRNRVDGWKITSEKTSAWVVKLTDSEVVAFAPMCTHLGCAYHWDAGRKEFACPCHTSNFSLEGKVLTGPAPRPLDRYQVKVEGNKILLGDIVKSA
jgi:menaquinol-cytochrome c reductase iron-sulfur subunit